MRTLIAAAVALAFLAAPARAEGGPESSLLTETVHLSKSDAGAQGYLAMQRGGSGRRPALILVQEWWGVTEWIKEGARRYAERGYVVVAPDLYRGKVAADADEAHQLMRGLPEDRAMGDLQAAFDYLASREDVDPEKIGVAGWCMGGGYALALGVQEPRLAAIIVNYGRLITDAAKVAKIKAPVQGNFGGIDKGIPPEDVNAFEKALVANGTPADFKVYAGAGHAFMNPDNARGFDKEAAADAWSRMDGFLQKYVKTK